MVSRFGPRLSRPSRGEGGGEGERKHELQHIRIFSGSVMDDAQFFISPTETAKTSSDVLDSGDCYDQYNLEMCCTCRIQY